MIELTSTGEVRFRVMRQYATSVELAGTFSGWHEQIIPMQPLAGVQGGWEVTLPLRAGVYLFCYRVNGIEEIVDPDAHGECTDARGNRRSRLFVPPARMDPDALAA